MQALQHGRHGVARVGAQDHEAALGHLLGGHRRQQLLQRVLVVVAVHDNREDAAPKGVHHGLQRLQLRVPGRHDAGSGAVSAKRYSVGCARSATHLCSDAGMLCATGRPLFSMNWA